MSAAFAYKQIDSDPTQLVYGQRFQWRGKTGTVGTVLCGKDGRPIAADFQRDDGVAERISLEKAHTPPANSSAQRAAPSVEGTLEEFAEGVFQSTSAYIDVAVGRKFTAITSAITELLERHRRELRDDIEELRALKTRNEAIEARLRLLESRRP